MFPVDEAFPAGRWLMHVVVVVGTHVFFVGEGRAQVAWCRTTKADGIGVCARSLSAVAIVGGGKAWYVCMPPVILRACCR